MKAGWEVKPLGEVCEYARGLTYKKADEVERSTKRVLRANNIDREASVLDYSEIRYLREDFEIPSAKKIARGSIIICTASGSKSHLGKVALVDTDEDFAFGGFMGLITPKNGLLPQFLHYAMTSQAYLDFIDQNTDGANINNLKFSQLAEFMFPIPPLEEQKRTVAVLDAAFEGLTRAKENAEANLQNARELFEAGLEEVLEQAGSDGSPSSLGRVCEFVGGSQPPKSEFLDAPTSEAIRLIQIRDYKSDDKAVYIPKRLARRFCSADDVMIGRYGPPLFQILRGIEGSYNVALMKAVPDPSILTKDFLFYFLRNKKILHYIIDASDRAAGQIGINKKTIEPYPITVPSLEKQRRAVRDLDKLEAKSLALVASARTKITDITELRQSLLQKAFAGELT